MRRKEDQQSHLEVRNLKAKKANVHRENIKVYKNRIPEILSIVSHHHIEEKVIEKKS